MDKRELRNLTDLELLGRLLEIEGQEWAGVIERRSLRHKAQRVREELARRELEEVA